MIFIRPCHVHKKKHLVSAVKDWAPKRAIDARVFLHLSEVLDVLARAEH